MSAEVRGSGVLKGRRPLRGLLARAAMEVILVVVCVYLAFTAPNFLTLPNFENILRSVALQGLIAFGMTMVIICREIDLSVGSAVAFSGVLFGWQLGKGVPLPVALVTTVAVGGLIGAFTGLMRVKFRVPSFISTLALFTALHGLALLVSGGYPITTLPGWFLDLGGGLFPIFVFAAAFVIIHFLMKHTAYGYSVYAVGGNDEAARLSGISVSVVRTSVFVITSALAALSGILNAARIGSGTPTVGQGWELEIIAAVIIGGTSFTGGIGTIRGTLVGIVFIGVIANGMTLLNVSPYTQHVVRGALILLAVLVNQLQERRT